MSESNTTKRQRVAFIHTVGSLVDIFRGLADTELPEIDAFHVLNESLLQDLLRDGTSAAITRRIVQQALLAADAGAELVVFTCSSTSPAIDAARLLTPVPIIKIDDPLAEQAVITGRRISILCTTQSTIVPSTELIRKHAAARDKTVEVEASLVEGAFDALRSGKRDVHDEKVMNAAQEIAPRADVLVLAQASLAHLREPLAAQLAIPVLSSPPLLMVALRHRLRA